MPFMFPRIVRCGNITLQKGLDLFFKDIKLKALFASMNVCLATPVTRTSFAMWSHIVVSLLMEKVSYCQGTFQELANTFVRALESYSGTILLNCEVRSINIDNNSVTGVTVDDGSMLYAPVIISNADSRHTYEQLLDSTIVPKKFLTHIQNLLPSLSCFSVYIGTDLPLHTVNVPHEIVMYNTLDTTKWFSGSDSTKNSNIIISIPSLTDTTVVPEGKHLLSIISFIPFKVFKTTERKEFTDFLLTQVNQVIPGLQSHIDFIESAVPNTFKRYTYNFMGSSLGWECSVDQVGDKRPSLQSPIEGLWQTGHWTTPGGGIYGVVVSGRKVAQKILGYRNSADFVKAITTIDS